MSGVVEKVKAKVDAVLHKDSTTHTTGTHSHSTNAGPHDTNVGNKVDPRVDSDRDGSHNAGAAQYGPGGHTSGTGIGGHTAGTGIGGHHSTSTNAGPHDSNLANKIDPRVDSDRDGSRNVGAAQYGPGSHNTTGTGIGGHHTTGTGIGGGHHTTSTNAGPHDSNIANKVDPRVDSDRDGSRNAGAAQYGPGSHATGTHNTSGIAGTGIGGHHTTSTNAGPHDSNILNKVDPRVDSDRDGSRNAGAAQYGPGGAHTGGTGYGTGTGLTGTAAHNAGPHDSSLLNKADPRVDSDRDGSRNLGAASHGAHSGTGPAHGTAGPHSSNLANKLDPRVDSDLDGSRTVGNTGNVGNTGY